MCVRERGQGGRQFIFLGYRSLDREKTYSYLERDMHHPEILDFEQFAVTGRDFGFYPLGRRYMDSLCGKKGGKDI